MVAVADAARTVAAGMRTGVAAGAEDADGDGVRAPAPGTEARRAAGSDRSVRRAESGDGSAVGRSVVISPEGDGESACAAGREAGLDRHDTLTVDNRNRGGAMRVQIFAPFGVRLASVGQDLDEIILTKAERATLGRAAEILRKVSETREARHPVDWFSGEEDAADLTFGWRICSDLAETGRIGA
jgi:hypothetical protein